jgi:hypothetical protein
MLLKISLYCSKILHKSFGIKILFQKNFWIKENVVHIFKLEIWTNSFVSLIKNNFFRRIIFKKEESLEEDISITKLEFFLKFLFWDFQTDLLNL